MTDSAANSRPPVFFLDTNVVHFVRIYLAFAAEHALPPMGKGDPEDALKCAFSGRTLHDFLKGCAIVDYLRRRSEEGGTVEYAPASQLELASGMLRGQAVLDAAAEGIPNRMWGRMGENEVLDRLNEKCYDRVHAEVAGVPMMLQQAGITIVETDPGRMRDVWPLSLELLRVVFLDLGDCMVYASALLAEAEELITSDGHFGRVVNGISNPRAHDGEVRACFERARDHLAGVVASLLLGSPPERVEFPSAPRIPLHGKSG